MTDDIDRLLADLDQVNTKALAGMVAATTDATNAAVRQARQNASGRKTLPHYPKSITGEVQVRGGFSFGTSGDHAGTVVGSVGPEKGGQGSLGHLIEYGSPTSEPHMDVNQAVDGEVPGLAAALRRIAGTLL